MITNCNCMVSIILPNYNHDRFLNQRINSILNQTYQDFELIILDDCSGDNSLTLLEQWKNHPKVSHFIVNEVNSGSPFRQWKRGIELAKGDWVWIAESDDLCELNFLSSMVNEICKKPHAGVVYAQSYDINEKGDRVYDRVKYTETFNPNIWNGSFSLNGLEFIQKYLSVKNVIPNASAVLFRREYCTPHIFDDSLMDMRMCGDWLFWIKLLENSEVVFLKEHLNYFREHEAVSRNHNNGLKRRRRLIEEQKVRSYMSGTLNVRHYPSESRLYKKWFELYNRIFFDLFSRDFYEVNLEMSKLSFVLKFLKFKTGRTY
jgi:glycosyltransferase involved in cell wall biosynthesis